MRYKEEQIGILKAQVDTLSAKVAKMEVVEEREKEIEQVLRQTHSEMVSFYTEQFTNSRHIAISPWPCRHCYSKIVSHC